MPLLPNWIYEPLPYVYAGVGIVAASSLDTLTGQLSGLLLISAGIVVGYQRYEYRLMQKQRQARLDWLKDQEHRKKIERQAWLRHQADEIREEIERKNDDF